MTENAFIAVLHFTVTNLLLFTGFMIQKLSCQPFYRGSAGTDPAADLYKFADKLRFSKKLNAISLGQGQVCTWSQTFQNYHFLEAIKVLIPISRKSFPVKEDSY
jgi:hypothetical protein